MSDRIHRILGFLGGVTALVSATLGGANLINPQAASWLAASASMLPVVATLWRNYFPQSTAP